VGLVNQVRTPKQIGSDGMKSSSLRVLAVSSGKGGVGKTNIVANLAYAFAKRSKTVLVVDADLGLNNIDILLGISPKFHIGHVLSGEKSIEEIIVRGPADIRLLPAGGGLQELTQLDQEKKVVLMDELDRISGGYDFLIFDTSAGISSNVTYFCSAAHETLLVATTEPTSLTDVYALIKTLYTKHAQKHFRVIVNSVGTEREALLIFRNLITVTDQFLPNVVVEYLGFILSDSNVPKAVRQQRVFMELYPYTKASQCVNQLAQKMVDENRPVTGKDQQALFWRTRF